MIVMNRTLSRFPLARFWVAVCALVWAAGRLAAQTPPAFTLVQVQTNHEVRLQVEGAKTANYRLDAAADPSLWTPLITLTNGTGTVEYTDSAAPFLAARYYRVAVADTNALTGDHLATDSGVATIHPIAHATMLIAWNGIILCVDPASGYTARFRGLPLADIVLVTHDHSDHYAADTISAVMKTNGTLVVSKSVNPLLPTKLKPNALVMTNWATVDVLGVNIRAIPAYNKNHPVGNGNGYILNLGGKNLYISGDTDDIPEMRALTDIDAAFLCMDGNYNMTMAKAASAAREFRPRIVFPYHYNTQNPATFKQLVGADLGIEVRLRKWE